MEEIMIARALKFIGLSVLFAVNVWVVMFAFFFDHWLLWATYVVVLLIDYYVYRKGYQYGA